MGRLKVENPAIFLLEQEDKNCQTCGAKFKKF